MDRGHCICSKVRSQELAHNTCALAIQLWSKNTSYSLFTDNFAMTVSLTQKTAHSKSLALFGHFRMNAFFRSVSAKMFAIPFFDYCILHVSDKRNKSFFFHKRVAMYSENFILPIRKFNQQSSWSFSLLLCKAE